jgi:hypothetical protein
MNRWKKYAIKYAGAIVLSSAMAVAGIGIPTWRYFILVFIAMLILPMWNETIDDWIGKPK